MIVVKQDTPFDKKGTKLSLAEFRMKYSYMISDNTTDDDLMQYIGNFSSHPQLKVSIGTAVSDWFELAGNQDGYRPLAVIIDGLIYRKEMDGLYHTYLLGSDHNREHALPLFKQPTEIQDMIKKSKFSSYIQYHTSNINQKL